MKYGRNEGLDYLRKYPQLSKWINTCICCGSMGYNPKLPKSLTRNLGQGEFSTISAQNIRKYFNPMSINELGMCETCQKLNTTLM